MLGGWSGTLGFLLFSYYLYGVGKSLYELTHPLYNLPPLSPRDLQHQVLPLWNQGQQFGLYCFLSGSQAFPAVNLTDLAQASKGKQAPLFLLYSKQGLVFNESSSSLSQHNDFEVLLNITAAQTHAPHQQHLPAPEVWRKLQRNSSDVYLHVLLVRAPSSSKASSEIVSSEAFASGRALHGKVAMVKTDRVPKSFKYRHLLSDWGLVPTDPLDAARARLPADTVISYWKPEVSVRLVSDWTHYPRPYLPDQIARNLIGASGGGRRQQQHQELFYRPPIHADEIGLTSDKYIPLNASVTELPLKLSYSAMSLQRWLLMQHLEESLSMQKEVLQFSDRDLDDVRRLISDTPLLLLLVTILASLLHLVFEVLSFQSDIAFWRDNKSLAGLSVRAVCTDLVSQTIVFLFLLDSDTSLLVTVPSFVAILIQCWKVQRATGLSLTVSLVFGVVPVPSVRLARLQSAQAEPGASELSEADAHKAEKEGLLTRVTLEADRLATTHLSLLLLPVTLGFTLRSLICDKHGGWYSWGIGSACGAVYAFGFALMCPQLWINHKLRSVAHMPWRYLGYKFISTFIDDLFAFVIKMPTMHRLSCFRDDIIFIIYLWQRWQYTVDQDRPHEK